LETFSVNISNTSFSAFLTKFLLETISHKSILLEQIQLAEILSITPEIILDDIISQKPIIDNLFLFFNSIE